MKNLEILDFKVSSILGVCTPSKGLAVLTESLVLIDNVYALHGTLRARHAETAMDPGKLSDLQLDYCDKVAGIIDNMQHIGFYMENSFVQEPVLYAKLQSMFDAITQLKTALNQINLMCIGLRDEDISILETLCLLILDVAPFFVLCEYDLITTYSCINTPDADLKVNEVVLTFLKNNVESIEKFTLKIVDLNIEFRTPMPLFDLPSEVVDAFYETGDIYAQELELHIDYLDSKDIQNVADGVIDAEELLRFVLDKIATEKEAEESRKNVIAAPSVMEAF